MRLQLDLACLRHGTCTLKHAAQCAQLQQAGMVECSTTSDKVLDNGVEGDEST